MLEQIRSLIAAALNERAEADSAIKTILDTPAAEAAEAPGLIAAAQEEAAAPLVKRVRRTPPPAVEPSEPEAPAAQTASSSEASPSVDYSVLQKAVFALAGKSRDAAAAVAAGFNVKTFKELPPEQWASALEAVTERLAILEA